MNRSRRSIALLAAVLLGIASCLIVGFAALAAENAPGSENEDVQHLADGELEPEVEDERETDDDDARDVYADAMRGRFGGRHELADPRGGPRPGERDRVLRPPIG